MTAQIKNTKEVSAPKFFWKEYVVLVLAGLLGVVGGLSAAWGVTAQTAAAGSVPVQLLAAGQLIQSAFWLLLAVGVGLWLSQKTGLGAPLLRGYFAGEKISELRAFTAELGPRRDPCRKC
jgi:hypothetical protein